MARGGYNASRAKRVRRGKPGAGGGRSNQGPIGESAAVCNCHAVDTGGAVAIAGKSKDGMSLTMVCEPSSQTFRHDALPAPESTAWLEAAPAWPAETRVVVTASGSAA